MVLRRLNTTGEVYKEEPKLVTSPSAIAAHVADDLLLKAVS